MEYKIERKNINDIKNLKIQARANAKELRKSIVEPEKKMLENDIYKLFINSLAYKNAKCIAFYVALPDEISTFEMIEKALTDNKQAAVPRCRTGFNVMDFYLIKSRDDLEKGHFGILEPSEKCTKIENVNEIGMAVIPALCFDLNGHRIGYGKGYYDRFLSKFDGVSAGLGYEKMLVKNLPKNRFDKKVDMIITDRRIINVSAGH